MQQCYTQPPSDALAVSPFADAPKEVDLTVFDKRDGLHLDAVLTAARQLVQQLNREGKFTDTHNFTLRCGVCGLGLRGEKEAVAHATLTKHAQFSEYK